MSDMWSGGRLKVSIFGESHGPAVGAVLDGLPAGEAVDLDAVNAEMARRAPGHSPLATARLETDEVQVVSGLYGGKTTGSAVCAVVQNQNTHSADYNSLLRPGHADLTALLKYGGHADMRGGGHFSGRLTAGLVFCGALAKQVLARRGVAVYGRLAAIGPVRDDTAAETREAWEEAAQKPFPVLDDAAGEGMRACILEAKAAGDSVGGVMALAAFGVPGGAGGPFFDSLESVIAHLLFSIPGVKGAEFGAGFALAALRGSAANDALSLVNSEITAQSNRCGGILGGISTGAPITVRVAVKPTPSIALPQATVDGAAMQPAILQTRGRHDPCIAPRALPVAEAALALAILDVML